MLEGTLSRFACRKGVEKVRLNAFCSVKGHPGEQEDPFSWKTAILGEFSFIKLRVSNFYNLYGSLKGPWVKHLISSV